VASGELSNEDWAAFRPLFVDVVGARNFLFTPEPEQVGEEDEILRRREKVPNLKGGEALGFGTEIPSATWESLASSIESGGVSALYIVDRDAFKVWGPRAGALFEKLDLVVYQGPYRGLTGDRAHFRLPATAYVEEGGSFTNFQGHLGRYDRALEPLGDARPDWWIFDGLRARLRSGAIPAREADEVKAL
jgi:formate dehydrogenase major subunit